MAEDSFVDDLLGDFVTDMLGEGKIDRYNVALLHAHVIQMYLRFRTITTVPEAQVDASVGQSSACEHSDACSISSSNSSSTRGRCDRTKSSKRLTREAYLESKTSNDSIVAFLKAECSAGRCPYQGSCRANINIKLNYAAVNEV